MSLCSLAIGRQHYRGGGECLSSVGSRVSFSNRTFQPHRSTETEKFADRIEIHYHF